MTKTNTEAVEAAYREGYSDADNSYSLAYNWEWSDARAALSPTAKTELSAAGLEECATIAERDNAELAVAMMYRAVTGKEAEWSSEFRLSHAVVEVEAALSAPTREREWLPIETAPKDGTAFVGSDGKYAYRTKMAKYYIKWPHEEGGPTFEEKWNAEDSGSVWPWRPTHWQPFPRIDNLLNEGAGQ